VIIGIGGEPATGKSTLVRELMKSLGPGIAWKRGLVSGTSHRYRELISVAVLGTYDHPTFPGTDRLSMGAQPKVLEWLDSEHRREEVVLFEGDRLFTGSFIEACRKRNEECFFYLLTANHADLERRHGQRGDSQSEKFKKGRATKYRNLSELPFLIKEKHETREDTERIVASLIADLDCAVGCQSRSNT
jgi:guanylate kinase